MYLLDPVREHATIASVGESTPAPCKLATLVQSRDANFAFTSADTPATGVALDSALPPRGDDSANTWRKRSSAV